MKYKSLLGSFSLLTGAAVFGYLIGLGINTWTFNVHAGQEKVQDQEKVVKLAYSHKPITKFSELKVGEKALKFGESFTAGEDWLKNLSFKLENNSGKPITYLALNVTFPETRATGYLMSYGVVFGQHPGIKIPQKNAPFLLKHNETLKISLSDEYDRLVKFINTRQSIDSLRQAELEIGFIVFEDKTAWAGDFMREDPNKPGSYISVDSNPQR